MAVKILPRDWFADEASWVRNTAEIHYLSTRPSPSPTPNSSTSLGKSDRAPRHVH